MQNRLIAVLLGLLLTGCGSTSYHTSADSNKKLTAADANIQLGINYLQAGNVTIAKQKLLIALDLAPDYPPAWYSMGYFLETTNEPKKANEYFLHAVKLDPKSGDVQNNYGTFLCHTGKARESLAHFIAATEDPNYVDTGAAFENAGFCALLIPNTQQAKNFFIQAINHDPQRYQSMIELAKIDYQQGNYLSAKQNLEVVLDANKATPTALKLMVNIAQKLGDNATAQMYSSKLKQLYPNAN